MLFIKKIVNARRQFFNLLFRILLSKPPDILIYVKAVTVEHFLPVGFLVRLHIIGYKPSVFLLEQLVYLAVCVLLLFLGKMISPGDRPVFRRFLELLNIPGCNFRPNVSQLVLQLHATFRQSKPVLIVQENVTLINNILRSILTFNLFVFICIGIILHRLNTDRSIIPLFTPYIIGIAGEYRKNRIALLKPVPFHHLFQGRLFLRNAPRLIHQLQHPCCRVTSTGSDAFVVFVNNLAGYGTRLVIRSGRRRTGKRRRQPVFIAFIITYPEITTAGHVIIKGLTVALIRHF